MTDISRLSTTRSLQDSISIQGPHLVEDAPNAFNFSRRRQVEVDWLGILEDAGVVASDEFVSNSAQFREYVVKRWGQEADAPPSTDIISKYCTEVTETRAAYIFDPNSVQVIKKIEKKILWGRYFSRRFWSPRIVPIADRSLKKTAGCVLEIPLPQGPSRFYMPIVEEFGDVVVSDLGPDKWHDTWGRITQLIQVSVSTDGVSEVQAEAASKNSFLFTEIVRADAALILQQWEYLKNEEDIAKALSKNASKVRGQLESAPVDAIEALIQQARQLDSYENDVSFNKKKLADAASDLGYVLFVDDEEAGRIQYTNDKGIAVTPKPPLKAGELFLKSRKTVNWTTTQSFAKGNIVGTVIGGIVGSALGGSIGGIVGGLFGGKKKRKNVVTQHSDTFDYYTKVDPDFDPWVEISEFYQKNGFRVFLLRETEGGLRANDGSTVKDIFLACENDEDFRLKCVVGYPIRERTIIGEEFLIGYRLILRPAPEVVASEFPEIEIDEQLSYRYAWTGTSLGELVTTIPLSPGETREVSVKTQQKYESKTSSSTTSLIEVSRLNRTDFETTFEKEVRKEKEKERTSSASASGSYGGIVSGSGSYSTTTKTKDIARQLDRAVRKTAQEINRKSKVETNFEFSESRETISSQSTSYTIENINSGVTLNVSFYRLLNNFKSQLRLDDGQVLLRSGASYVSETNLRDTKAYGSLESLTQIVDEIVDDMVRDGTFPVDLKDLTDAQYSAVSEGIISAICRSTKDNFPGSEECAHSENLFEQVAKRETIENELLSLNIEVFDAALEAQTKYDGELAVVHEKLAKLKFSRNEAYKAVMNSYSSCPVSVSEEFAYDSSGLYADVALGSATGVEPYAEQMRQNEVRKGIAENRLIQERANYLNWRAFKDGDLLDLIDPQKAYCTKFEILETSNSGVRIKLQLHPTSLPTSKWILELGGNGDLERFYLEQVLDRGTIQFRIPVSVYNRFGMKDWEDDVSKPEGLLALVHELTSSDIKIQYRG